MAGYHGNSRYVQDGKIVPNPDDSQKTQDKWQKSYDNFKGKQAAAQGQDLKRKQ